MENIQYPEQLPVSLERFFNVIDLWKIKMIFNKLLLLSKDRASRKFLKKEDNLFNYFFKKNFNYQIALRDKKIVKDLLNKQNPLRNSILFAKDLPVNEEVIIVNHDMLSKKSIISNLTNILENLLLTKEKKEKKETFDILENYIDFQNQYRSISNYLKDVLFYIIAKKKKMIFETLKSASLNLNSLNKGFDMFDNFFNKKQNSNKTLVFQLIRKFLLVKKILLKVYKPFPFNIEQLSLRILSEYDNQPRALYSVTRKNVNYIKILGLMKYVDNLKNEKEGKIIQSIFRLFQAEIKTEKKLRNKILNLVKVFWYLKKKKESEVFFKLISINNFNQTAKYFLNFLKFFFVKKNLKFVEMFFIKLQNRKKSNLSKMETGVIYKREGRIKKNGLKMLIFVLDHVLKKKLKTAFYIIHQKKKTEKKQEKILYGKIQNLKRPKFFKTDNLSVIESENQINTHIESSLYKRVKTPQSINNSFYKQKRIVPSDKQLLDKKLLVLLPTSKGHFIQKIVTNPRINSKTKLPKKNISLTPTKRTVKNGELFSNPKILITQNFTQKKVNKKKNQNKVNLLPLLNEHNSEKRRFVITKTVNVKAEPLSMNTTQRSNKLSYLSNKITDLK